MDLIMFILKVIAMAIPAFLITTACHEAGHIIAGLLNKWKFMYFSTGPVMIYRESLDSKIKIGLSKELITWFGFSATLPAEDKEENTDIFAKILIAGPIGSFVTGLIFLISAILTRSEFLVMTSMIAIAQGVSTALPINIKSAASNNDGRRFLDIRKGGKKGEEEKAAFLIAVNNQLFPAAPSDESLVRTLTDSDDIVTRYGGLCYARRNASLLKDEEKLADLKAQIALLEDKVPASVRNIYSAI